VIAMPWCDDCDRFLTPNSLSVDGRCPSCGSVVAEPSTDAAAGAEVEEEYRAPWHFKVMVVALVVYLGWRAYEIIERIVS
jgi:predicted RNA-binding Zn-ribbon protein involved in translation (DUF1610 family)